MDYDITFNTSSSTYEFVELAPLPVPQQAVPMPVRMKETCTKKACPQKDTTMYTANENKDYLASRLDEVFYAQEETLSKQFGLSRDKAPRTAKEFIQRIKDGMFELPGERDDYGMSSIIWRDPSVKEDKEGFSAAFKQLKDAKKRVEDQIMIAENDDALKAIYDFESWKPSKTKH